MNQTEVSNEDKRECVLMAIASVARLYGAKPLMQSHVTGRLPDCVESALFRSILAELAAAGVITFTTVRTGARGRPPILISVLHSETNRDRAGEAAAQFILAYARRSAGTALTPSPATCMPPYTQPAPSHGVTHAPAE